VSRKSWIIFVVAVVGLLVSLVVWSKNNSTTIDVGGINLYEEQLASPENGNIADHVFGKADSKVVLIEYGDYQCPGCASINPAIEKMIEEYKDKIKFIFRNFPLTSSHPNAKAAAGVAEAAGLQGNFWEMHTKLYANQSAWSNASGQERTDVFSGYANSLNLELSKFLSDLSSSEVSQKISFDQTLGKESGVDATPTFFINGSVVDGSVLQDAQQAEGALFRKALDDALAQNK